MSTRHAKTSTRHVGVAVTTLAMVLGTVLTAAAPASAATKRTISLKATPSSVVAGAKVTLTGTLSKSPKRTKVLIQKLSGSTWKSFKTTKTTSPKGTFKIVFAAAGTGTTQYRAVASKTKKLKAVTSKTRAVKVRAVAPKPKPSVPTTPVPTTPSPTTPSPTTPPPTPNTGVTTKVSQAADGSGANSYSHLPSISADGSYIAFSSRAKNIVPSGQGHDEIFVTNRATGHTVQVSQGIGGTTANSSSQFPQLSADGRYVLYYSMASNIVADDPDDYKTDLFVWDRQSGATIMVPKDISGSDNSAGGSISADGRYVVYTNSVQVGDAPLVHKIIEWDRQTGALTEIVRAHDGGAPNGGSTSPDISADNRYIVFDSEASNLVTGDTNGKDDTFSWDRNTGLITKISHAVGGGGSNGHNWSARISADGRHVVYVSKSSNLVSGDVSSYYGVYSWDRQTDTTTKVSLPAGVADPGGSTEPNISTDGRYISYLSWSEEVVPGDTNDARDIFLWDRQTGIRSKVTQAMNGGQINSSAYDPSMSGDGRYIVYRTASTNIVPGDTNRTDDVFLWDRLGNS